MKASTTSLVMSPTEVMPRSTRNWELRRGPPDPALPEPAGVHRPFPPLLLRRVRAWRRASPIRA